MKVEYRESFEKDFRRVGDAQLAKQIRKLILRLETAGSVSEVPNIKRLAGGSNFYRARCGDYRIGLTFQGNSVTLVRVLHRKEIYRYFP